MIRHAEFRRAVGSQPSEINRNSIEISYRIAANALQPDKQQTPATPHNAVGNKSQVVGGGCSSNAEFRNRKGLPQFMRIIRVRATKKLGRLDLSSVQFLAGPEQNDFRVPRSTKGRANVKRLKTGRISPCDGEFSIAYDVSCDQSFADPYPFSWYP